MASAFNTLQSRITPSARVVSNAGSNFGTADPFAVNRYAGPVPAGYNQSYYTSTGITRPTNTGTGNGAVPTAAATVPTAAGPQTEAAPNYDNQISEMYAPALKSVDDAKTLLQDTRTQEDVANQTLLDKNLANTEAEKNTLQGGLTNTINNFNNSVRKALAQAVQFYNGTNQRSQAMYGSGSSLGQAMGELGQQEFLRQQGNIGQQEVEGLGNFGQKKLELDQYITGKIGSYKDYYDQAKTQIGNYFSQKMQEIAARKDDIEANKTRDKLALLQNTREKLQEVQNTDRAWRQSLASWGLEQMQNIQGRVLQPAEAQQVINQYMTMPLASSNVQSTTTRNPNQARTQDEMAGLMNPFTG